jgi:hypothetical protein
MAISLKPIYRGLSHSFLSRKIQRKSLNAYVCLFCALRVHSLCAFEPYSLGVIVEVCFQQVLFGCICYLGWLQLARGSNKANQ